MVTTLRRKSNTTSIRFKDDYTRKVVSKAAELQGQSVTGFILTAIRDRAENVIRERQTVIQEVESLLLSPDESVGFLRTLATPPRPNAALRDAMKASQKAGLVRKG